MAQQNKKKDFENDPKDPSDKKLDGISGGNPTPPPTTTKFPYTFDQFWDTSAEEVVQKVGQHKFWQMLKEYGGIMDEGGKDSPFTKKHYKKNDWIGKMKGDPNEPKYIGR